MQPRSILPGPRTVSGQYSVARAVPRRGRGGATNITSPGHRLGATIRVQSTFLHRPAYARHGSGAGLVIGGQAESGVSGRTATYRPRRPAGESQRADGPSATAQRARGQSCRDRTLVVAGAYSRGSNLPRVPDSSLPSGRRSLPLHPADPGGTRLDPREALPARHNQREKALDRWNRTRVRKRCVSVYAWRITESPRHCRGTPPPAPTEEGGALQDAGGPQALDPGRLAPNGDRSRAARRGHGAAGCFSQCSRGGARGGDRPPARRQPVPLVRATLRSPPRRGVPVVSTSDGVSLFPFSPVV